jgi:hypothetical protein
LEYVFVFGFGKLPQLVNGDGRTARFGDVVLAMIFMLVHPLEAVSQIVVPCLGQARQDGALAASTEKVPILTIVNPEMS